MIDINELNTRKTKRMIMYVRKSELCKTKGIIS